MGDSGVVIDANALQRMVAEIETARSPGNKGPLEVLVDRIGKVHGLAYSPHIEHEWRATCGDLFISGWLPQKVQAGQVCLVNLRSTGKVRQELVKVCGLPQSSRDHHYVACAKEVLPRYVLTEDMDLFDPREKQGSAKAKARRDRQGRACRFIYKRFSVTIGCFCHSTDDLQLGFLIPAANLPGCHGG